jgi:hypothetical protein
MVNQSGRLVRVTLGDPLPPIILNIVVDKVVHALLNNPSLENIKGLFHSYDGW